MYIDYWRATLAPGEKHLWACLVDAREHACEFAYDLGGARMLAVRIN